MIEPLIVLASPRSCSTVTVALLSGHPRLCGVPELTLFPDQPLGVALQDRFSPYTQDGAWHGRALQLGVAWIKFGTLAPHAMSATGRLLRARPELGTADLLRELVADAAPQILVEKSPRTAGADRALSDCLRTFPHARYLHLVRDPGSVVASQVRHWRLRGMFGDESDGTLLARAVNQWYFTQRRILDVLDQLPSTQWRRVHAQSLLSDPAPQLRALLSWLELDDRAATIDAMRHTERWPFVGEDEPVGGDQGFLASPRLRPPRSATPIGRVPRQVAARVCGLAERLGCPRPHIEWDVA